MNDCDYLLADDDGEPFLCVGGAGGGVFSRLVSVDRCCRNMPKDIKLAQHVSQCFVPVMVVRRVLKR